MRTPTAFRAARSAINGLQRRSYSQAGAPRHLLSIGDLKPGEFSNLVRNAKSWKDAVKAGQAPSSISTGLANQTVAMMFSKRSTRTRVSTEAAVTMLGGNPMFLGKDDIQLGVPFALHFSKALSGMLTLGIGQ
jgi:ornithine carbamoyltransferase